MKMGLGLGTGISTALLAIVMALPITAQASVMQMELISGNDCSGVFGSGFSNCRVDGSPSIIKYNESLAVSEISVNYPSIDGSEFVFSDPDTDNVTGTWTYNPGVGDPAVRFWSAKAGPEFYLFYMTPNVGDGRSEAQSVTTGTWITPLERELSHIVFYDTGSFPPVQIDEPATLVLLGLSLLGFGLGVRRKAASS
jgi:hypothetical protein